MSPILRYMRKGSDVLKWVKRSQVINFNVRILLPHIQYLENWAKSKIKRYQNQKQLTIIALIFRNILTEFYIFIFICATPLGCNFIGFLVAEML